MITNIEHILWTLSLNDVIALLRLSVCLFVSVAFEITYISGTRIFITVRCLLRREGLKHVYVFLLVDSVNSCLLMLPNNCNTWHEDVGATVIQSVGAIERASE